MRDRDVFTKRIDAVIRFFLYLLLFWLPYGSAVIESCVILAFIVWVLKRWIIFLYESKKEKATLAYWTHLIKSFKPKPSPLNKPIVFFLLACLISVFGSHYLHQSLHNFITKTLEWFIVYFLVLEVFTSKKHIFTAIAIFLFTAFSTGLDGIVQYYITHKDIFMGHVIKPGGQATAGFSTPNGLGGYLTFVFCLLFAHCFKPFKKISHKSLLAIMIVIIGWALFLSFSQGAWLGVGVGMLVALTWLLESKKKLLFSF